MRNAFNPVINLDEKFPHKIDLFVQVYETIIDKVGDRIPPHKWSHYRMGLLTQGSADYTCGIYKFKAKENTLLMIPPHVVNSSVNWSPDSKGYFLLFNLDFFLQSHFPFSHLKNKKILQSSVQPNIQLNPEQADSVEEIFKTIFAEKNDDNPYKKELIALKIIELLIQIERLYLEVHEFDDNQITLDLVRQFSDLIELNFARERSVAFYASALNIHPNYLNAVIKNHSGMTAKDSIQNRLLLETKYLLHHTRLSIKEIAHQLGFDDPNYFAVFFKRSEGLSPIAYRASVL
jgi:AraC-like DNA-binding protein